MESHDPNGADRSLKGSIVSNAGVTRFTGNYDTHDLTAGCGYEFTAEKR